MKKKLLSFCLFFCLSVLASQLPCAAAEVYPLNRGWTFHHGFQPVGEVQTVDLPHTWNKGDAMYGTADYYRGLCRYARPLAVPARWAGKRIFLRVEAAQTVADVFVDRRFVMQHRGGYTAFVAELTDFLQPGQESELAIYVNNAASFDIAPICGDFTQPGGLYRGVELLVTDEVCIAPDFYASSGVFFTQSEVSERSARLRMEALLSHKNTTLDGCEVEFQLWDEGRQIHTATVRDFTPDGRACAETTVQRPHLWDGVRDPHLYEAVVILRRDGQEIDRRTEEIGFRYYHADPEQGFFLNGHPYRLNGVCRHQERAERAVALYPSDHDEDLDLMQEMGCTAVRLAHYPQAKYVHRQMDRRGLVAWAEISFVNVYVAHPAYADNLRQQLKELIYQNYNHPCILAWGLFNEINSGWLDRPSAMAQELHELAHSLDPSRLTMGASNQQDDFNGFTDLIAFNRYFGWYDGEPDQMGEWLDREHAAHPERKIGISEYGAGGSPFQQADTLERPTAGGPWHPENWQTYYHIENWRQLKARPYLWCNFVWCMFDFSAAGRREGSDPGRNDKGLVTVDRRIKKDAFYFYKANWNTEDKFVYLAGRRADRRTRSVTTVQAFSNSGPAELFLNGEPLGEAVPDAVNVMEWKNVRLREGKNELLLKNKYGEDRCTWFLADRTDL
ncbi:MAG TPA: glycoside hydrolase family 2 protein [Candidatus Bacteroides merdipullorum]|uniref:Glycoside hydrolase family 2 protein n=1 Tax=Candidatus Bacteroides merdipullorum TaxID=2838474 RepID=A0A9D2CXH4_9BACE|nr:glycoside hydrolase family 2 protein [Candidatus Bacteroides merdipullorum]